MLGAGSEVGLLNKRTCIPIDFPILSQPSKGTEMSTPRAAVKTSRPATSAACKRQVWMDTIIQLQKQNKAIKTSDLPSPTEGEVVLRIGSAAHLPNLIYKGKTWREL